jgi:hypothetical protein
VDGEIPKANNDGNIVTKREMTYNEYLALSEEDRMKNIEYHITDLPGEGTPVLGVASFIGSFQYGIRTDTPLGYLRCDGNEYPADSYNDFIVQYLLTNKIPYKSLDDYQNELDNNNDNCSIFGYDNPADGGDGLILRVPKLKDNVFIAQALTAGNIGKYNKEGLPNITGAGGWYDRLAYTTARDDEVTGALYLVNNTTRVGNESLGTNKSMVNFDASLSNPIYGNSEHVIPNHIQYPLFVCVSNQSQPITEDNVNLFVDGLTNKTSIDGSNANLSNLSSAALHNLWTKLSMDTSSGVTITASQQPYTALTDGFVHFEYTTGSSTATDRSIVVNGLTRSSVQCNWNSVLEVPVLAGDVVQCLTNSGVTLRDFTFYGVDPNSVRS